MVMKSTGIITTVAGTGTAGYSGDGGLATYSKLRIPDAVTVDASGNIYIADTRNRRIRMVNTGIITIVGGTGTLRSSGDGGLATSAMISDPRGVAFDVSGNIYITDSNNSTSIITTVAGNRTAGYSADGGEAKSSLLNRPEGIAVDASGNTYVCDTGNGRLRVLLLEEVPAASPTISPSVAPIPSPNTVTTPSPTPRPNAVSAPTLTTIPSPTTAFALNPTPSPTPSPDTVSTPTPSPNTVSTPSPTPSLNTVSTPTLTPTPSGIDSHTYFHSQPQRCIHSV
jgi:trimeric autotransporter adhesin